MQSDNTSGFREDVYGNPVPVGRYSSSGTGGWGGVGGGTGVPPDDLPRCDGGSGVNKEEYEESLRERQRQHLEAVERNKNANWRPCMHDQCQGCHGTGIKIDGSHCVHMLACNCSKCSPYSMLAKIESGPNAEDPNPMFNPVNFRPQDFNRDDLWTKHSNIMAKTNFVNRNGDMYTDECLKDLASKNDHLEFDGNKLVGTFFLKI